MAERFELYVCGVELANAFGELTDAVEQRRRFEADMAFKQQLYGVRYPIDEDFLAALAHGLPESAGIALGLDRIVMLLVGAPNMREVVAFPKTAKAIDLMVDAPTPVSPQQLKELHIRTTS